jgi:O-antigen/teichoic acid export membrane protein
MQTLTARVIRGGAWMLALNMSGRVVTAVRLLVLARLVAPLDFGLVGMALAVTTLLEAFSATGVQLALIQRRDRSRALFDTAWTVGLIRGAVLGLALVAAAPAVGAFFGSAELVPVVRAMALVPLLRGLTNIGVVELRRELNLRPYYLLHTAGVVADVCVAVPLALAGGSAWALVAGWLALTATRVVLSYVLHPYRPRPRLDPRHLRELFGFGRWVSVAAAIDWLLTDGVLVIVGKLFGIHVLGLYQMAWRLASLPTTEMTSVVGGVSLPAYAELQDSPGRLQRAYLRVLAVVALVAVPIGIGIVAYADELVRLLLGARWSDAVPILRALAVFGLLRTLAATVTPLLEGTGRSRRQAAIAGIEVLALAVLLVPLTRWWGPVGVAAAVTAGAAAGAVATLRALRRLLALGPWKVASVLAGPLVAALVAILPGLVLSPAPATASGVMHALGLSALLYVSALLGLDGLSRLSPRVAGPWGTGVWRRRRA